MISTQAERLPRVYVALPLGAAATKRGLADGQEAEAALVVAVMANGSGLLSAPPFLGLHTHLLLRRARARQGVEASNHPFPLSFAEREAAGRRSGFVISFGLAGLLLLDSWLRRPKDKRRR